jgi:hypothetical protein
LIEVVQARWAGWRPRGGAGRADLDALRAHFAPLIVPDELIEVLSVMNGSPDDTAITLDNSGPLLSCDQIVAETRSRTDVDRDVHESQSEYGQSGWSPSWIVITSKGWNFMAVLGVPRERERSAVIDLSYGNQDNPIEASSLTALVAASADAWQQGLHPRQTWRHEDPTRYIDAYPLLRDLVATREAQYPGEDGLAQGDGVGPDPRSWPLDWSQPDHPATVPDDVAPLQRAIDRVGAVERIQVTVDHRVGRYLRIHDQHVSCWLDLPPGFEKGRPVTTGAVLDVFVNHDHPNPTRPDPPSEIASLVGPVLRVIGVMPP